MKKSGLVLAVLLCFLLSGCGGGKPKEMSDAHYQYGMRALEIVDNCLDLKIDADTAFEKIKELQSQEDNLPEIEVGDPGGPKNFSVKSDVSLISTTLSFIRLDKRDLSDLLADRNRLAEDIGEAKR